MCQFSEENKTNKESKWMDFFFDICDAISKKSKDPSTKVGCVIVNSGNSIISTGYNGFPIGVKDNLEVINFKGITFPSKRYERPEKYLWTAHAEENAIALAARNGICLNGSSLYVTRMCPCTRCTRLIIQAGIKRVISFINVPEETLKRWEEDNDIADIMMKESGVEVIKFYKRGEIYNKK